MVENTTAEVKSQLVGDINGKYYLWQPWFLTGKLRLTFTGDKTSDSRANRESWSLGGNITANILPLSRYPLSLGYSKSNNTISDSDSFVNSTGQVVNLGDTSTTTSYFITQQYLGKRFKLAASYHFDENESDTNGRYSSHKRKLEFIRRDLHNDINLTVQQREDQQHNNHEQRDNKTAVLTHNFYPSQDFNISNFVSSIEQLDQRDLDGDGTVDDYRNAIDQVSSMISWRSSDKKTHINGSLRYTGIETGQDINRYENVSGNAGLSARYRFNQNVTALASASQTDSELNDVSSEQRSRAILLRYNSDNIDLAGARYNWGASAGQSRITTDNSTEDTRDLSLDHNASHNWQVGRKGRISLGANQTLTQQEISRQEDKTILAQGVRLGYTRADNGGTRYAQTSYSESRNIHGIEEFNSQVNIQLSQQQQLSTHSSINASLTYQQSRYQDPAQDTRSDSKSLLLNYATRRNYMFQTLTFNSSARYSMHNSNAAEDSESYTWDNVIKHQIGMLSSSLTLRIQEIQGLNSSLLLINIKRRF